MSQDKFTVEEAKLLLERRCIGSATYLVLPNVGSPFIWPGFSGGYFVSGVDFSTLEAAIRDVLLTRDMLNED